MTNAAHQGDLLAWPAIHDAEEYAARADEAWRRAQRRFHLAPHGEREKRLSALRTASHEALRAELELVRVRREYGQ